jgi:hypothetical protein
VVNWVFLWQTIEKNGSPSEGIKSTNNINENKKYKKRPKSIQFFLMFLRRFFQAK